MASAWFGNKVTATARLGITAVLLLLAACTTRSISNAGYPGDQQARNPFYAGELRESDVIGLAEETSFDDSTIASELASARQLVLQPRQKLLVIQSGAMGPDEPMIGALKPYFDVGTFSGVPDRGGATASRRLRLAAARGGYPTILCYWGVLEAAQDSQVTKAVSWVPIAGWLLPDEVQRMRISLRAVLVDVPTGRWSMVMPDSFEDASLSALVTRRSADQGQVEVLKRQAYEALARRIGAMSAL
jgi:hypothetical protein